VRASYIIDVGGALLAGKAARNSCAAEGAGSIDIVRYVISIFAIPTPKCTSSSRVAVGAMGLPTRTGSTGSIVNSVVPALACIAGEGADISADLAVGDVGGAKGAGMARSHEV
jgi:hypothetical protein